MKHARAEYGITPSKRRSDLCPLVEYRPASNRPRTALLALLFLGVRGVVDDLQHGCRDPRSVQLDDARVDVNNGNRLVTPGLELGVGEESATIREDGPRWESTRTRS